MRVIEQLTKHLFEQGLLTAEDVRDLFGRGLVSEDQARDLIGQQEQPQLGEEVQKEINPFDETEEVLRREGKPKVGSGRGAKTRGRKGNRTKDNTKSALRLRQELDRLLRASPLAVEFLNKLTEQLGGKDRGFEQVVQYLSSVLVDEFDAAIAKLVLEGIGSLESLQDFLLLNVRGVIQNFLRSKEFTHVKDPSPLTWSIPIVFSRMSQNNEAIALASAVLSLQARTARAFRNHLSSKRRIVKTLPASYFECELLAILAGAVEKAEGRELMLERDKATIFHERLADPQVYEHSYELRLYIAPFDYSELSKGWFLMRWKSVRLAERLFPEVADIFMEGWLYTSSIRLWRTTGLGVWHELLNALENRSRCFKDRLNENMRSDVVALFHDPSPLVRSAMLLEHARDRSFDFKAVVDARHTSDLLDLYNVEILKWEPDRFASYWRSIGELPDELEKVLEVVRGELRSKNRDRRFAAMSAVAGLGREGSIRCLDLLLHVFRQYDHNFGRDDRKAIEFAMRALASVGDLLPIDCRSIVMSLVNYWHLDFQRPAVEAMIGFAKSNPQEFLPIAVKDLSSSKERKALLLNVIDALMTTDMESLVLPVLVDCLDLSDPELADLYSQEKSSKAGRILKRTTCRVGDDLVPKLLKYLSQDNQEISTVAIELLLRCESPALIVAVPFVERSSSQASGPAKKLLEKIGASDPDDTARRIEEFLLDTDAMALWVIALTALRKSGSSRFSLVFSKIVSELDAYREEVRDALIDIVSDIGHPDAASSVPALLRLTDTSDVKLRKRVLEILHRIAIKPEPETVLPWIERQVSEWDDGPRTLAVRLISRIDSTHPKFESEVFPLLEGFLRADRRWFPGKTWGEHWWVRGFAFEVLNGLGAPYIERLIHVVWEGLSLGLEQSMSPQEWSELKWRVRSVRQGAMRSLLLCNPKYCEFVSKDLEVFARSEDETEAELARAVLQRIAVS